MRLRQLRAESFAGLDEEAADAMAEPRVERTKRRLDIAGLRSLVAHPGVDQERPFVMLDQPAVNRQGRGKAPAHKKAQFAGDPAALANQKLLLDRYHACPDCLNATRAH